MLKSLKYPVGAQHLLHPRNCSTLLSFYSPKLTLAEQIIVWSNKRNCLISSSEIGQVGPTSPLYFWHWRCRLCPDDHFSSGNCRARWPRAGPDPQECCSCAHAHLHILNDRSCQAMVLYWTFKLTRSPTRRSLFVLAVEEVTEHNILLWSNWQ